MEFSVVDPDSWADTDVDEDEETDMAAVSAVSAGTTEGVRLVDAALSRLDSRVSDLTHLQTTLTRKADELQRAMSDLEASKESTDANQRFQIVKERATVYRVTSMAMVNKLIL
ncbi:unnamed protein product [Protopolystoma xenopodis]|uniref:Uncharacterized protein n=1 Tax=Protopolystoma xenopodis TaxID=117903 RepID=A0A3S5ANP6_9PLAT|nr:unnamed protein product [Protopolystoma xenopodis]